MRMKLSEIEKILETKYKGNECVIEGVSTDTRTLKSGDLFVAIMGEHFDGNDLTSEAKEKGAVAAIVSRPIDTDIPHFIVKDTCMALGKIASYWRERFNIPIIGLTGSCGKTTTKGMLASILSQHHKVLAPERSMNTNIGVPLTLLQLNDEHQFAVIEMGTNHFREISYITKITHPNIALVTGIHPVHLEFLKDIKGVIQAKAEIFEGLSEEGIAILNADDSNTNSLQKLIGSHKQLLYFGAHHKADIKAKYITANDDGTFNFELVIDNANIPIKLPLLGEHNVSNALAAASAAYVIGINNADIKAGLENVRPVKQRLVKRVGFNGMTIIDDSYSANPDAVDAALNILSREKGEKVFVFGAMGELDPNEAEKLHRYIGDQAKQYGIHHLFAVGALTRHTVDAFGRGAEYFETKQALIEKLRKMIHKDMAVLIKGSRGMKMEDVVHALIP